VFEERPGPVLEESVYGGCLKRAFTEGREFLQKVSVEGVCQGSPWGKTAP
jgi:hypothetical protein